MKSGLKVVINPEQLVTFGTWGREGDGKMALNSISSFSVTGNVHSGTSVLWLYGDILQGQY